jgi:hypothetical protein
LYVNEAALNRLMSIDNRRGGEKGFGKIVNANGRIVAPSDMTPERGLENI